MTKFGKIFCNLVANFKGVQLSPLGFAACQSKNCTNKANRAISRGCTCLRSALPLARARSAPTKQTVQTIGGYGIPAIPTQPPNYLPTEATEHTEVSDAKYSTTDGTDVHRLGGYGIPAIPTQPPNYLPTEPYAA